MKADSKISAIRQTSFSRFASVAVCGIALFGPAFLFFISGVSLSSVHEEPFGYRYFNSLRIAFGGEFPWIPQGHLVGLTHVLTQYLLNFAGVQENQLFPRIDVFAILVVLPPLTLFIVSAIALARKYRSGATAFLVQALSLAFMTSGILPLFWATLPEYHGGIVPLVFITAAWTISILENPRECDRRTWVLLGFYAGMAVAIKPTLAVFPLLVGAALLLTGKFNWRLASNVVIAVAIAPITFLAIVHLYYGFSLQRTIQHFIFLRNFVAGQSSTLPRVYTLAELVHIFSAEPALLATVFAPIALAIVCYFSSCPRIALLSFAAVPSIVFAFTRYYGNTLIEVLSFAACELAIALWIMERKVLFRAIAVIASTLILVLTMPRYWDFVQGSLNYNRILNTTSAMFQGRLNGGPQPTWILTTSNEFQPHSIIGGMCKGSLRSPDLQLGESPYFSRQFPDFRCAMMNTAGVPDVHLNTVGFGRGGNETITEAINRVEQYFSISLATYDCTDLDTLTVAGGLVYCYPVQQKNGMK